MFVLDVPPEVPPQDAPMMMVVASTEDDKHRTVGACRVVQNLSHGRENLPNGLTPDTSAGLYFEIFESTKLGYEGKVTLLRGPDHGVLELIGVNSWDYLPNQADYLGFDSATFLVEIEGYTVELTYGIKVVDYIGSGYEGATIHEYPENCPNGEYWKISPDGQITPLKRELEEDRGSIEDLFQETLAIDRFTLSFEDLVNGALGEASGGTITLDNNANGQGWYIDLTPGLNEEFLPTANPYEWKAKPGSETEGKIDLLTEGFKGSDSLIDSRGQTH